MSPKERLCVKLFVASYIVVFSVYAIGRHNRFNSSALDLGIQDNVLWNTIHGRAFASSIETPHYLGDHVTLTIPLFSLLYLLWEDVRMILIAQTVLLAIGAFPLAAFAAEKLKRPWAAPAIALAYLLYPPLGFINRFDFHPEVAVIPLFLFAALCFERKKPHWGYLLTLLVLLSKEQMGIIIGFWGISLLLFEQNWRRGLLFILVGFGWSWIALFHIIPHFRGGPSDTLLRYGDLAETPGQLLLLCVREPATILTHLFGSSERLLYLWNLLWPLAGLCLLCPRLFLPALPVLAYNLLSNNVNQHSLYYQYNAPAIPWLFLSATGGLACLQSGKGWRHLPWSREFSPVIPKLFWVLPAGCLLAFLVFNPLTTKIRPPHFEVYSWEEPGNAPQLRRAAKMIPPEAELSTTMALLPHFSHRRGIFLWWGGAYFDSDFILVNLHDHRWLTRSWNEYLEGLQQAIDQHGHKVIYSDNGIVLTENFRKRTDPTEKIQDLLQSKLGNPLPVDLEWDPKDGQPKVLYSAGGALLNPLTGEETMDAGRPFSPYVAFEFIPGRSAILALNENGNVTGKRLAGVPRSARTRHGDAERPFSIFVDIELAPDGQGYYLLDRFGRVYTFGSARHRGDDRKHRGSGEAVDLEVAPDGKGYFILRSYGRLATFGHVRIKGLPEPFGWDIARDLCLTGAGSGYLLDGFGGVHALGEATPLRCGAYQLEDRMIDLEFDPQGQAWILDRDGRLHPASPAGE